MAADRWASYGCRMTDECLAARGRGVRNEPRPFLFERKRTTLVRVDVTAPRAVTAPFV